jgi:5-oxoprolinase (ATP-hydrolysing)
MPKMTMTTRLRLAADIGGTFTDIVLDDGSRRRTSKVLTTPRAPEQAVLDGAAVLLAEAGRTFSEIDVLVHGTTLATNCIIERKGARTALIATEGFRDIIEIADESRYDQYDVLIEKPSLLVPRRWRYTIPERMDVSGRVLLALDEAAVETIATAIDRERIEAVAVAFMHGYANPAHEERTRDMLARRLPALAITLASQVCPEVREYERTSTAVANAYVQPLMAGYLGRLEAAFRNRGLRAPIHLMTSGGSLASIEAARRFPIRLVESGPAGGAILAAHIAAERGLSEILSFDMGGTTAKICLIENGEPLKARSFEVDRSSRFMKGSGLPVRIPVIEMVEIGAGGGSIARVDALKRIHVGPESAGSEPGPAALSRGGDRPTVTDADLALGRIDPARFAGGSITLDQQAAERSIGEHVAAKLGIDQATAAWGIGEIVDENMANAARVHAVERGFDVAGRTLVAFGGAAPLHACRLAEKLGIHRIVVPADAGVGSAIGFLLAPTAFEIVRSRHMRLEAFDHIAAAELLDSMGCEAEALARSAATDARLTVSRQAFMRYVGQGHEIAVPVPDGPLRDGIADQLRTAFEAEYDRLFARHIPSARIEVMNWAVLATTGTEKPGSLTPPRASTAPAPIGQREIVAYSGSARASVPVYDRASLTPGCSVTGPCVIVESGTGTIVSKRFDATVDAGGALVLTVKAVAGIRSAGAGSGDSDIARQVMWNRLIAVVEEQAQVLLRTAFSPIVREAGDLSAGVFDAKGRMLAQAVTGTPGHVNSMALSVEHFIRHFGVDAMKEGDVYITNDPWMGTGHTNDFVLTTPVFLQGKLVALFSCTSHLMDIGGIGFGADATDVFMEGLHIPFLKLFDEGKPNETLFTMIRANTRLPVDTIGDVYSLANCNEIGRRRLVSMMEEFGLDRLDALADHICTRSREAVLAEIAKLPKGTWRYQMTVDGFEAPITLSATTTVGEGGVHVDYTGTSPQARRGINIPLAYTTAYTVFGLACAIAPRVPNNAGSLAPYTVSSPEGTLLNALKPAAVLARHITGQMLPDMVFGCLSQAVPDRVPAEGTSCLWNITLRGRLADGDTGNYGFATTFTSNGGTGARPATDGLSATSYPSGVKGTPVEIGEQLMPVVFWKKELRADSGGPGRTRGGLGQIIEIESRIGQPFELLAAFDRILHPPRGRDGGGDGQPGVARLASGKVLAGKGTQTIPPGERLVLMTSGGGGLGRPAARDRAKVAEDAREGRISPAAAKTTYAAE